MEWGVSSNCSVAADGATIALLRKGEQQSPTTELLIHEWHAGREPTTLRIADDVVNLAWSPDGALIICAGREHLWLVHADSERVGELDFDVWAAPTGRPDIGWTPDSEWLCVAVNSEVWLLNVQSCAARRVYQF